MAEMFCCVWCLRECSGKLKIGDLDSRRGHIFNAERCSVLSKSGANRHWENTIDGVETSGCQYVLLAFSLNCTALLKILMMRQRWKTLLYGQIGTRDYHLSTRLCVSSIKHWRFFSVLISKTLGNIEHPFVPIFIIFQRKIIKKMIKKT